MKTYADIIKVIEESDKRLSVAVIFSEKNWTWLPVDKAEYLRQLKMISNPEIPYPCWLELEPYGEMFIHPKVKND